MPTERLRFPGSEGHELAGRLERPDTAPRAGVLFAHCFTCSKDTKAAVRVSRALAERGFAVLRFDFTGLGASDGAFEETTFTSNIADVLAATRRLAEVAEPRLLTGRTPS